MKVSVFQTLLALCIVSLATCFTTKAPTVGNRLQTSALPMKGLLKKVFGSKEAEKNNGPDDFVDTSVATKTYVSKTAQMKSKLNSRKYKKIDDLEERAYQVLVDLELVQKTN